MGIFFTTNHLGYQIGMPDFLWCFFSTISYNLEPDGWGTRFPKTILDFCDSSKVDFKDLNEFKNEIKTIRKELSEYSVDNVVYDIERIGVMPPWHDNIADDIKDLSDYFRTSNGAKDIFFVIEKAIEDAEDFKKPLEIILL